MDATSVEDGLLPGYNPGNGISDPYGLNHKYYEMLHGWTSERRQRPSGAFDTYYIHKSKCTKCRSIPDVRRYIFGGFDKLKVEVDQETNEIREIMVGVVGNRSKKRKEECSNSKRKSAVKKQKSTNCCDKIEVKVLLADAKNNLNWSWHRRSRELWIRQIMGGLVGDNEGASNGGFAAGLGYDEDHVSMVGIIRKRSQRRKRKYSFSKRDFATKKHNNNNFDKTERKARR